LEIKINPILSFEILKILNSMYENNQLNKI